MNMRRTQGVVLAVLALFFAAVAVYYWVTPAESLLHFMPGYEAGVAQTHFKHGLAALIITLGCGVLLWFTTGKKPVASVPPEQE